IRALGRLWRVNEVRQLEIGASLGADIPYFFEGGTVLGLERGDRLFPLRDGSPAWVVLLLPSFTVSTREAFGWLHARRRRRSRRRVHRQGELVNDLQAGVAERYPGVARLVRLLPDR